MRRSICFCEPSHVKAGEVSNWKFTYTTSIELSKGAQLKFDLLSMGRPMDWEIPSVNLNDKNNVIWAEIPNGKILKAKKIENHETLYAQFEFVLPTNLSIGESLSIFIGSSTKNAKGGNQAQTYSQRKRQFVLHIDPKGKGDYKEKEFFHLDVKGNSLKNLRILSPSLVSRNRRFDVIVRFEDSFGNLTNFAPEGTLIELSYENLRENLNWKLFVPETGFLTLPNLYFNEPGIYRIKLKNLKTNETFFSPPIKCFAETDLSIFWGLFHGESDRVDSGENIESCLRYFRDEKTLQFFASSSFDSLEETSNDAWKNICHHIAEFNEDERFIAFLGSTWVGNHGEEGVRQFVFLKDNKPIVRKKDLKNNSLKKIYKTTPLKELISIPTMTMGKKSSFDFQDFNPEFERVVEIYNAWGSSECLAKEGNTRPIKGKLSQEDADGSIQEALNNNCRFGFVAGGLDDRGIYSDFYDNQVQYSPGLTAIVSKDQTREALFEAIHQRSCYATTGERIILGFDIAGKPMGSQLSTGTKPGLAFNRYITGYVVGTAPLSSIEIFRNGKLFKSYSSEGKDHFDFIYDDNDPLADTCLFHKKTDTYFCYYYLRAIQTNGQIAWSSPIWIDLNEKINGKKNKRK
jgi:hypothetical protein